MSPTTTPSHLTTNPVTTTALITSLSRRSLSLSRHRPTTPVTTIAAFTDYAVHNLQKTGNIDPRVNKKHIYIPCPCTKCLNHIEHKVEEVQYHLYKHRIDISYTKWTKHEKEDDPSISAPKPINATTEFVDDMDFSYIPTDGPVTVEMVNATKDNFDVGDLVKFQELLLDVEKPLYEGCPDFTKLSAIVKLLNLNGKYEASNKFFTELLGLIKKMLPAGNEMVEKTYQAKKVMRLMGSGYKKIHVCIKNCFLYWKNDKDLTACQTYGTSRGKVDNKTKKVYENIPAKVMVMSSPNHPTSNIEDAFSSNFLDYIPALPDYVPASLRKTYSSSSNNSFGLVPIASPTLSLFHDDPYMKELLPLKKRGRDRSSSSTSALPQAFKIGESSRKTSMERHEEQIKEILNHLDELSLDRIEHIEDKIEDYFPATPGNTSFDSSNDLTKYLLATLVFSPLHDDPYMEIMQAYDAISPPQVTIPPPAVLPPSPVLSLSPMFNSRDFFPPEEIPPPKDTETPVESPIPISPSSSVYLRRVR
ncbi:putative reverse transcriptase domain-containing protein [Tanacetum coccineum]